VVQEVLRDVALERGDQVQILIFTTREDWLPKKLRGLPNLQIVTGVNVERFPVTLKALQIDLGLAPLADEAFNACKSGIKFYEYSLAGAATIASAFPEAKERGPYGEIISGKTGVLIRGDRYIRWKRAVNALLDDFSLRTRIAIAARAWVLQHRSILSPQAVKVVRSIYAPLARSS